jgi:hypothetical protein
VATERDPKQTRFENHLRTRLAEAVEALRGSEGKYRALIESIGDGLPVCHLIWGRERRPVDYIILETNRAYERESGFLRAKLVGRPITELLPGSSRNAWRGMRKSSAPASPYVLKNLNPFWPAGLKSSPAPCAVVMLCKSRMKEGSDMPPTKSKATAKKKAKRPSAKRKKPGLNVVEYTLQEIPDVDTTLLRSEDERYYHNPDRSRTPEISGGDLDADWQRPDVGEEAVSGSVATPDQDIVEELGRAVGVTYADDEPLDPERKIAKRDEKRWELNPASSEDYKERTKRLGKKK